MPNHVFVGMSLDGYIADADNSVQWLNDYPQEMGADSHFSNFMESMDALIMGRRTFEAVCSFGQWPYTKPVMVLSKSLQELAPQYAGKAVLCPESIEGVLAKAHGLGYENLYIDGGQLIQSFLQKDFIDSLTITTIPIVLGGGIALFGNLIAPLRFEHIHTEILSGGLVMSGYMRTRKK